MHTKSSGLMQTLAAFGDADFILMRWAENVFLSVFVSHGNGTIWSTRMAQSSRVGKHTHTHTHIHTGKQQFFDTWVRREKSKRGKEEEKCARNVLVAS